MGDNVGVNLNLNVKHLGVFVLLVSLWVAGCGGTQAPACEIPEQGNLLIYATDRVNPDEDGKALPTIVRIYQLKNLGKMEVASFRDIWQKAEDTLGDSLAVADEVTVYPGEKVTRRFERDKAANYIVGVAIVRRPAGGSWRTILDLPMSSSAKRCAALQEDPEKAPNEQSISRVVFRLDGYAIEGDLRTEDSAGCPSGDLDCLQSRAESAVPEMPDQEEAPEAPSTPEQPSMGMPSVGAGGI